MEKNRVPTFRGLCFFQLWKKTESTKSGDSVFLHSIFLPCLGLCFFSELKIFGLLSPSLPLVCWSQGLWYGFLACNGIIICTRPNVLRTMLRKRATYSTVVRTLWLLKLLKLLGSFKRIGIFRILKLLGILKLLKLAQLLTLRLSVRSLASSGN